jgi:hypothetical protein
MRRDRPINQEGGGTRCSRRLPDADRVLETLMKNDLRERGYLPKASKAAGKRK